jgi:hypothetical protein
VWQLVRGLDLVEHDRAVANRRADDAVAVPSQHLDERRDALGLHDEGVGVGSGQDGHGSIPAQHRGAGANRHQ